MEVKMEDYIECIALIVISGGVIATAIYAEKIFRLLSNKGN
jgi:hypothetical protein